MKSLYKSEREMYPDVCSWFRKFLESSSGTPGSTSRILPKRFCRNGSFRRGFITTFLDIRHMRSRSM